MTALAAAFLQFSIVVLAHELGHFVFARLVGVQVLGFNIGFGPALWSKTCGGTCYALRLVPLGGFVQLAGLDAAAEPAPGAKSFMAKSWGRRFSIIGGGALFNFVLAWLIFVCQFTLRQPRDVALATLHFGRLVGGFLQMLGAFLLNPELAGLSGPLAVLQMSAQSFQQGWPAFWFFTAFLSLNLGVFNLLPLPALDGGRLVFLLYELLLRRRPNPAVERWAHALGFVFLLCLIVLISFRDVAGLGR